MQVILFEPEIPPNTGNIARLCAATRTRLHLIEPLGFSLEDRYLKRAGLDYWPSVDLSVWPNWEMFIKGCPGLRLVFTSARRGQLYYQFSFKPGDGLVFGPETRGCPPELLDRYPDQVVTVPIWGPVRSLNLSTTVGIVLYEAFRQTGFPEASGKGSA
ncbi:MAG: tRNA (cytidine(34)-2'-O)-methyltransferase [Deltaproteobacteria bacterium]|nr:tRNA (cytidine(34)-2'-O)-methyltransferase [Deltaproteobacteria bacterium]